MAQMQRGIDEQHEQDPRLLLRDTRTLGRRIYDFYQSKVAMGVALLCAALGSFILPGWVDIFFLFGLFSFAYTVTRKTKLPFRMPMHSGFIDHNDLAPGTKKPRKARGILFMGNEQKTNQELWFSNEDMRTHALIFGSTGSGKTEALVSLAFNALVQGSGFIYVDGKGDNSLYAKVFSMARAMGRDDDILIVNFMTGARDIVGPQEKRLSNTMNPFATGSSSMLTQLVVSLMDQSSATPDGDMWKGRAISFVEALMKVLVAMRDSGDLLLDANAVRQYFTLDRIEAMVVDKLFIRDGGLDPVSLEKVPETVLEPVTNYLATLPGYDKTKKGKQSGQTLEQHGFITMQLTRVFTSLADTYGHILRTNLAEVDMRDVVLNRRILVVLLPAMEKSPDELSNLGKVIIATLKAMMAAGLGDEVEGEYRDVIERKPTNAPTPYLCILDEYGYYAVPGFAVVPAQARSLGFSTIFAGQDLPAFQKASKEEAMSIGANTNIKIAMKLEDPLETWDFFAKTAGEAYVTKVDAFQTRAESMTNTYLDTRSSSFEKRARVDLLDLKEQTEGEAHIFFKSKIVRMRFFYANPKPVQRMRINHFLKVEKPDTTKLVAFERRLAHFQSLLDTDELLFDPGAVVEDIVVLSDLMARPSDASHVERAVTALIDFSEKENGDIEAAEEDWFPEEQEEVAEDQLNLFTKLRLGGRDPSLLRTQDLEAFSQPILPKLILKDQISLLEQLSGRQTRHANNISEELIKDMQIATYYPPEIEHFPSAISFSEAVDTILQNLQTKKDET